MSYCGTRRRSEITLSVPSGSLVRLAWVYLPSATAPVVAAAISMNPMTPGSRPPLQAKIFAIVFYEANVPKGAQAKHHSNLNVVVVIVVIVVSQN